MLRLLRAQVAALLLIQALILPALGAGSPFKGQWTSTDSDGSTQRLIVSSGATPSVVFEDFYASSCARFGPATHWVSSGKGELDGNDLIVAFHNSGCGTFSIGAYDDFWTYQSGSDTLLDSVGITWTRLP